MTYMLMSGIKKEDTLTPINFDKWVGEYGNPSIAIENVKNFNRKYGTDVSALVFFMLAEKVCINTGPMIEYLM
ncbi:Uncharacterised protein [Campylobacter hyointestinalis]|uniref:hypothetical protein n=1 Tax=Campylobacter hyointestinalis TaxID=198 RepID=UPI000729D846|nr:hypothetical protein [Campylobacter hyointestinalis]CUU88839.1 Uncharacterised protein [Campylobacter hyointestinalis]